MTAALVKGGGSVRETSAVEVNREIVGVRPVGQSVKFGGRIDGPEFGRLGQRERVRFWEMDAVPPLECGREIDGAQLGVRRVDREEFAAAGENSGAAHSSVSMWAWA